MLIFGEKNDLLLIKKIEQFSKTIAKEKDIINYINLHRRDLLDLSVELQNRINSIKDYYNDKNRIDFNNRNKICKKEITSLINRFVSKHIIDNLVKHGYFDNYKLKEKVDKKTKKVLHNYFD